MRFLCAGEDITIFNTQYYLLDKKYISLPAMLFVVYSFFLAFV